MDNAAPPTPAPHTLPPIEIGRALRKAAALARDGDWRTISIDFDEHPFPPLAALAAAARDALYSFAQHQIGPYQVADMAEPMDKPAVDDLLHVFGCW